MEWCGLIVDFCDGFYQLFGLSFWRHPFTADYPWVSKWSNAKFPQICSEELTNKLIHILDDLRLSKCIADENVLVKYSFKIEVQIVYSLLDVFHFWIFLKLQKYKNYLTCWMHHIVHPDHPRPVIISACIIELITIDDPDKKIQWIQQLKFFILTSAKLSVPTLSLFMNGRAKWLHFMLQW